MWDLNNWNGGYPKGCCLYVGYVLIVGLPCVASVGEEGPSLADLKYQGWGWISSPPQWRREGYGERIVEWVMERGAMSGM